MNNQDLAPIVLFTYNRLLHTKRTIEALQKNELADKSELFIFSDAPKNDNVAKDVEDVRKYLKTVIGFKKVSILEKKENFGLAKSIINGVTQIINKYNKIIVLEDDLVTNKFFLRYMNDSLNFYQNDKKVMHITGYMFPIEKQNLPDTFFIKPASCWSWATWKDSWSLYKKDSDLYLNLFSKEMRKEFDLNNTHRFFKQIKDNKKGEINTWAIFWYASIFLKGGLSLHPKETFVKNIGHDGSGVHCGKTSVFDDQLIAKYPIKFTTEIKENIVARKNLEIYYKKIKLPLKDRIINKIQRILKQ